MNIEQTIRQYLPNIIHMSLATVADGKPWAFEVHYAFDDELNLYWVSEQTARHSQELMANPHVSGTIVTQHIPDQPPLGVSFEGTVEVLEDIGTDHPGFKAYAARFASRAQIVEDDYIERTPTGRRIYKVTVNDYYLSGVIDGKMGKEHLPWKTKD